MAVEGRGDCRRWRLVCERRDCPATELGMHRASLRRWLAMTDLVGAHGRAPLYHVVRRREVGGPHPQAPLPAGRGELSGCGVVRRDGTPPLAKAATPMAVEGRGDCRRWRLVCERRDCPATELRMHRASLPRWLAMTDWSGRGDQLSRASCRGWGRGLESGLTRKNGC